MLRADVVVVEPLSLVLSQRQDLARAIRELVEAIHRTNVLLRRLMSTSGAMLARAPSSATGPTRGLEVPRRLPGARLPERGRPAARGSSNRRRWMRTGNETARRLAGRTSCATDWDQESA